MFFQSLLKDKYLYIFVRITGFTLMFEDKRSWSKTNLQNVFVQKVTLGDAEKIIVGQKTKQKKQKRKLSLERSIK